MNYEGRRRQTQNYTGISKEEGERRMLEGYKRLAELKKLGMFDINNNTTPTKQQKLNEISKELAENRSYKLEIQGKLDLKNKELKELKEKELKDEQDYQVIKDINEEMDGLMLERTKFTEKINSLNYYYLSLSEEADQGGGKRKSKRNSKKVAKKPVVSQKKKSIYKEILGKQMKIYKMPDSRKEYVKYKGELLRISDYKDLMKQKAMVKTKTKTKVTKVTQQKAKSKTKK